MLRINHFEVADTLAYLFLWTTFYFALCLWNPARSYEWHCRVVTVVHAVIVSAMAMYCTYYVGPSPFSEAGGPNSPLQVRTASVCLAYFIFDMTWCFYFQTEGPVMLAHHSLSILGLTWCLVGGYYGTEIVATIGGAEMTNPLLQLRWFLRETGYHRSILADVTDWVFMVSFGVLRIGLGSHLLYSYYQQDTDVWGRFGATSIYIISWIFFMNIVSFAIRKYRPRFQAWLKPQKCCPGSTETVPDLAFSDRPDIYQRKTLNQSKTSQNGDWCVS